MNLLLCLLLALAVFAGPAGGSEPPPERVPFIIYTSFSARPSDAVRSSIRDEVTSIIEPIGWKPEWRSLDDSSSLVSTRMAIVRFKGVCDVDDLNVYPAYETIVLGQTYTVDGAIIPIADVYCSAIRAKLAEGLTRTDAKSREFVFGRATARVVAHELYHILTKEKHHTSGGIAEGHFTAEELLSNGFRFRQKAVSKLRRNLVPTLLSSKGLRQQQGLERGPRIFISSGCSGCHGFAGGGTPWGPALRLAGRGFTAAELAFRLADTGTEMYRRATGMGLPWPSLRPGEITALFDYLSSLRAESPFAAAY